MPEHYEREEKPPLPSAPPLDEAVGNPFELGFRDGNIGLVAASSGAFWLVAGTKVSADAIRYVYDAVKWRIVTANQKLESLRAALAAAEKERDAARAWKADAMKVLLAYDDVIRPHGRLGELLTDTAARIVDERDAARLEAERLRAFVSDVAEIATERPDIDDRYKVRSFNRWVSKARALLAAKEAPRAE